MKPEPILSPKLPALSAGSHKRTRGRVVVIGGSRGLAGAARLAGRGALAAGAGLVELAVPASIRDECVPEPAFMVTGLRETLSGALAWAALADLRRLQSGGGAMVLGPGLGRHEDTLALVRHVHHEAAAPVVVDADGLFALAGDPRPAAGPRVFTPHAGEAARLIDMSAEDITRDRVGAVLELWRRLGGVVVLKGHETLVTDGARIFVNTTGHAGLARGGSGDVLSGIIAAFLAAGLQPLDAAAAGVFIHGRAAERARPASEARSLTLDELIAAIPDAMVSPG